MSEEKIFGGFPLPTKNFFSMPNCITDIISDINNISELKVVLYVLRHTWGYHEYDTPKPITNDEFMHGRKYTHGENKGKRIDKGTKLSEQAVRNGLEKAVDHGYLICDVDDSDKARIKKYYRLKMQEDNDSEVKTLDPKTLDPIVASPPQNFRGQNFVPPAYDSCASGLQNVDLRPTNHVPRSEKETKEKNTRKTNKERTNAPSLTQSSDSSSAEKETSIWTPEEEVLLSWLDSAKIGRNKDTNVVKDQLKELAPVISSIEMLHKEIEFVRGRISGNDPTVYLGNLVGNNLKAWLQTQQPEPEEEQVTQPTSAQIGMSKEEATDLLYNNILMHYPSLVYGMCEDNNRYYIGIAKSDTEWIDILNPEKWYYLPNFETEIELALAYAERMQVAV